MTQYPVPQFIEVEDKIIGPLSLRQFFIALVGAGIIVGFVKLVPSRVLAIIMSLPVAGLTLGLVFGKFNGRPLSSLFSSGLGFFSAPQNYTFHKGDFASVAPKVEVQPAKPLPAAPSAAERLSRLRKLSYILDQEARSEETLIKEKFTHLK